MYPYRKKTLWEQFKLWSKPKIKRLGIWMMIVGICVIADRIWLLYQTWEDDTRLATKIIIAETLGSMAEWGSLLIEGIVVVGGTGIVLYGLMMFGLYYCYMRKERYEKNEWLNKAQDEVNQYAQEALQKAQGQIDHCAAEYLEKLKDITVKQRLYVEQAITRFRAMHASQHFIPAYQVIGHADISHQGELLEHNQERKQEASKDAGSGQDPVAEHGSRCNTTDEALDQDPLAVSGEGARPGREPDQAPGQCVATRLTLSGNIITNPDEGVQKSGLVAVRRDSDDADGPGPYKPGVDNRADSLSAGQDQPFNELLAIRNEVRALVGKPPLTESPEKKGSKSTQDIQEVTTVEEADWQCKSGGVEDTYVLVESPAKRESTANLVDQVSSGNPKEDDREKAGPASDEYIGYERSNRNNNPLVTAIIRFMENRDVWKGSPSELWDALENLVDDCSKESQEWPKSPSWIIRKLSDADYELMKSNITWTTGRTHQGRWCEIFRVNEGA